LTTPLKGYVSAQQHNWTLH